MRSFLDFSVIFLDFSVIFLDFSNSLSHHCIVAWVTRPERLKGVKDVIKQARRAQRPATYFPFLPYLSHDLSYFGIFAIYYIIVLTCFYGEVIFVIWLKHCMGGTSPLRRTMFAINTTTLQNVSKSVKAAPKTWLKFGKVVYNKLVREWYFP